MGRSRRSRRSTETVGLADRHCGLLLDPTGEAAAHLPVLEHRVDYVGGDSDHELADDLRPTAALAELTSDRPGFAAPATSAKLDSPPAAGQALLDHSAALAMRTTRPRAAGRSTWRARSSALVGLRGGDVLGPHLGLDPGAVDRCPVTGQIFPDRQVERAAVVERITSWKVPFPNERVPTTVA